MINWSLGNKIKAMDKVRGKQARRWKEIAFYGLLLLLILAPLPFGSNRPWSEALMATVTAILLLVWSVDNALNRFALHIPLRRIWYITLPFSFVIIWAVAQITLSVPQDWTHPIWGAMSEFADETVPSRITLNTDNSITVIMRLLCYASVFWLALQFGRSGHRARIILKAVVFAGLAYALYGIMVDVSGAKKILWYPKWAYLDSLTSSFVNRNSYATYAGIGALASIILLFDSIFPDSRRLSARQLKEALLTNFASYSYRYLLVTVTIMAALILTHSRAGIASFAVGLIVLFLTISSTRQMQARRKWIMTVVTIFMLLMAAMFISGGDDTFDRFAKLDGDAENRVKIYSNTLNIIKDNPLLGTGLGNFENTYRFYSLPPERVKISSRVDRAHNTYLEAAVELGIPAAILIVMPVFFMIMLCIRGVKQRKRNGIYPALGVAMSALVGVHALFDFSIEIPAVAFTYSVLMGVCCAQSWPSEKKKSGGIRKGTVPTAMPVMNPPAMAIPDVIMSEKDAGVKPEPKTQMIAQNTRPSSYGTVTFCILLSALLFYLGFPRFMAAYNTLSGNEILQLIHKGKQVGAEESEKLVESRRNAMRWINNSRLNSELGLAKFTLAMVGEFNESKKNRLLMESYEHTFDSLVKSPAEPYNWMQLATLHGIAEGASADFADSIQMSIMTGPSEYPLTLHRLMLGIPTWEKFDEEGKSMMQSQICEAWQVNPKGVRTLFEEEAAQTFVCYMLLQCPVSSNEEENSKKYDRSFCDPLLDEPDDSIEEEEEIIGSIEKVRQIS